MEKNDCDHKTACSSCDSVNQCDEKTKKDHEDQLLKETLTQIRYKIFVLSGKGGVGKSTVSTNLATALSLRGYETGILDIDIHGPNVAKMLGLEGMGLAADKDNVKIIPFQPFPHLKVISMAGLLPDSDAPIIWRGPLKMAAIRQFIGDVAWGALDFLIVDSPPGTGDEPLSVAQLIPDANGAVIVTTPQEVALLDSRKSVNFAKQINLPVLGIIENMSGMQCPHCNARISLFGQGGGKQAAEDLSVPFLGALPLEPDMPHHCDKGRPYIFDNENSSLGTAFNRIVDRLLDGLNSKPGKGKSPLVA